MERFYRPSSVRFSTVTQRGETRRWRVDGRGAEKAFVHKSVAERFRADLERAYRDGEEFDRVSLLARSMATNATPRVAEWVYHYAVTDLPKLQPKSRAALGDDLISLVEHTSEEGAPGWGRPDRRMVREWLAGRSELSKELAGVSEISVGFSPSWLVKSCICRDDLYYLTQRFGAYVARSNRS